MSNLEPTEVAAKAVGLSKWFLYRNWPQIPAAYRAGRALRWDVEALRMWMREQATKLPHIQKVERDETCGSCENFQGEAQPCTVRGFLVEGHLPVGTCCDYLPKPFSSEKI